MRINVDFTTIFFLDDPRKFTVFKTKTQVGFLGDLKSDVIQALFILAFDWLEQTKH